MKKLKLKSNSTIN